MTFVFNKCFLDIIKWEKDSCITCKKTKSELCINDTIPGVLKIPVLNIDNKIISPINLMILTAH